MIRSILPVQIACLAISVSRGKPGSVDIEVSNLGVS